MKKTRFSPNQIVRILGEHDNGKSVMGIIGLLNTGIASNTINSDELFVELKKINNY